MILLKQIKLNNFLSHAETTLDFNEGDKTLIDGQSGSGKSSIFEAIIWAIYGEGRAENRSLVRKGQKKATVRLELIQKEGPTETVFTIVRSVLLSGKHILELFINENGVEQAYPVSGVRETQEYIDKHLIGASYLLFINSVAYVQGNTDSFVAQTAPKRKDLLLEIIKAEDYNKHYENARRTLSNLGNDNSRLAGGINEMEVILEATKARLTDRNDCLRRLNNHSEELKIVEADIRFFEEKTSSVATLNQTKGSLTPVLDNLQKDRVSLEVIITNNKRKIADKPIPNVDMATGASDQIILDTLRTILESNTEEEAKRNAVMSRKPIYRDRSSEIASLGGNINKIKEQPVCPSGTSCPYSGNYTEQVESLEARVKECNDEMSKESSVVALWEQEVATLTPPNDIRSTLREIKDVEDRIRRRESFIREIKEIVSLEEKTPALELSLNEKNVAYDEITKQIQSVDDSIEKMSTNITHLKMKRVEKNDLDKKMSYVKIELEQIDKDESAIKVMEGKIVASREESKIITEKMRKVALLKDAFGSKGIETMVIDYLLPKLEDRVNVVLSRMSDFRVRIDTQKKSADGETTVEGLFITILNEMNEEMPFEAYSGGEKLKISVAISESLATLQKVGFRLFDETFTGLDENSTEKFADVLQKLNSSFSQVLCVSHLLQIKELFDHQIKVVKTNSISRVSV